MKAVNKVVKILILSDFFLLSAWGLIMPILAIFIVGQIKGGDVRVAGMAIGIYWILKSLIQVPIGKYLDKNHGEKDDYYFMIGGTFLTSMVPLGFIFAFLPWHVYLLQGIHAVGMAMAVPSWGGIFTRHINKGKEAMIWSLESSSIGMGAGIAGIIGGIIAKAFGFTYLFIGASVLGMVSAFLFFLIKKDIFPKAKDKVFYVPKIL